tara:strand:+ start:112 stop:414 length:303 start_codon:yes stop_codon:yes gene_type:complete
MDKSEIQGRLRYLGRCELNVRELELEIETLFANEPHWSEDLDPEDDQTWVFCFVSDDSPEDTRHPLWVRQLSKGGYVGHGRDWKYATPFDLSLRYTKGEK